MSVCVYRFCDSAAAGMNRLETTDHLFIHEREGTGCFIEKYANAFPCIKDDETSVLTRDTSRRGMENNLDTRATHNAGTDYMTMQDG